MTINSTTRKTIALAGNGNTHTYAFTFKVFADEDIVVKKLETSTSIETTLTLGASNDYIVTLNSDQNGNPGGSITLKSGGENYNLPSGFYIVITSGVSSLQGTDLTNQGGFYPEVINDALDRSAILHQQQQIEIDRSIKFSLTNTIGSLEITDNATKRANKVLGFDSAGEFTTTHEIGDFRGDWAAGTSYSIRDIVRDPNNKNIYMAVTAHTSSGNAPLLTNADLSKWSLIVDAAAITSYISSTAPTNPVSGTIWYDKVSGRGFIYYQDGDSAQWVESNPSFDQGAELKDIKNAAIANDAAIAMSKLDLAITNSEVASDAAIAFSKIDSSSVSISNSHVANDAAIAATKVSFTQSGTGASARTVTSRFQDTISVKDFGALGDGSNNDTTAIQNALNEGAGDGVSVYLPAGTYIVHETIRIPSNTHFFGSGEKSIIKMDKDVDNVKTLVRTGERNDKRKNIIIEDMTLDFNRERWQYRDPSQSNYLTLRTDNYVANGNDYPNDPVINDGDTTDDDFDYGGTDNQHYYAHTLSICFSENVLIKNVRALDGYKHSIDISSPKYRRGYKHSNSQFESDGESALQGPQIYDTVRQNGTATKVDESFIITVSITGHGYDVGDEIYLNVTGTQFDKLYKIETKTDDTFTVIALRSNESFTDSSCYVIQDQGSRYVTLENCYATGAGDDNITTHYSSDLLITGCLSEFPSGAKVPTNSNCYEIDDGSRNVTLTNCIARGGAKGIQIKGHAYAPAPYNVTIDGLRIYNCSEGMDIKHTKWGATGVARSGSDFVNLNNNWAGGNTITNPSHQIRSGDIPYTGVSPTAKNLTISNVQIIAPKGFRPLKDDDDKGLMKVHKQIQLYAYENVKLSNILISDGGFDLAGDQDPAYSALAEFTSGDTTTLEADDNSPEDSDGEPIPLVHIFYGANQVMIKNLSIYGFRSCGLGLKVGSTFLQHFSIDGISIVDGPKVGVEFSEAYGKWVGIIDNYLILRKDTGDPQSGSVGIRNAEQGDDFILGNGNITKYETDVQTIS